MQEIKVIMVDETGLHARPAGIFAKLASKFSSQITVEAMGKSANAKSIMNLMSMGISKNCEMHIKADGADEGEAVAQLGHLITSNFAPASASAS